MKPIYLVIVLSLLAACTGSRSTPMPSSQALVTTVTNQAITPTPTNKPATPTLPSPTSTSTKIPATPTFTPTPTPALPTDKTLIAYESAGVTNKRLVFIDPLAATTWEFRLPDGAVFATPFLHGLSPDGKYFVYFTGATAGMYDILEVDPLNFAINVMDLSKQQTIFSMPILSPQYPADLKPLVEMTEDQYWMHYTNRQEKLDEMEYTLRSTMLSAIRRVAWSQDGDLLAFASQNPGPSSDLYFFGRFSGKAWRVTSEPGHVIRITWAPNSRYQPESERIALETTFYSTQATRITTDLLTRVGIPTGSVGPYDYFTSWDDPNNILLQFWIDFGDPGSELVLMNADSGKQTMLWENSFENYAIAPDWSSLLITSSQPNNPGDPGLFFKLWNAQTPVQLSKSRFWNVAYWGSDQYAYAASAPNKGMFDAPQAGGTFGITQSGKMSLIDEGFWELLASPDGKFLAAYGPYHSRPGLRVFTGDGTLVVILSDSIIQCLKWEATSDRLAYQVGKSLYVWEEGDQSPRLLGNQLEDELDYDECGFTWFNTALPILPPSH